MRTAFPGGTLKTLVNRTKHAANAGNERISTKGSGAPRKYEPMLDARLAKLIAAHATTFLGEVTAYPP